MEGQGYQDLLTVVGRVPLPPDDLEYDEGDDGSRAYTARWRKPGAAFSLTFAGNGHVVGCLVYSDRERRGSVWRWPLSDKRVDEKIREDLLDFQEST